MFSESNSSRSNKHKYRRKRCRSLKKETEETVYIADNISETAELDSPPQRLRRSARIANEVLRKNRSRIPYASSFTLCELPDDCLLAIFRRLPPRYLIVVERVSSRWQHLALQAWKNVHSIDFWDMIEHCWEKYSDPHSEPQVFLQNTLQRCGQNLKCLNLSSCPSFRFSRYSVQLIVDYCPNLEHLRLCGRLLSEKSVEALPQLTGLKSLGLTRCFDQGSYDARRSLDKTLSWVLQCFPKLQDLCIEYNKAESSWGKGGTWFRDLKIRSLHVGNSSMNADALETFIAGNTGYIREFRASENTFASGNWTNSYKGLRLVAKALRSWQTSLRCLELRDFTGANAVELQEAISLLPTLTHLRELSFRSNRLISEELVGEICTNCQRLEAVNLSGCSLKLRGLLPLARLKHLKELSLAKIKCVDDDLIALLAGGGTLQVVDIRDCIKITTLSIDALLLNCAEIQEIDLRGCHCVDSAQIEANYGQFAGSVKILAWDTV